MDQFREESACGEVWAGGVLFQVYLVIKQKRRAVKLSFNVMQSVGESNPCYQDENLAS